MAKAVLKMKHEIASTDDLSSWVFKPEFYYVGGGIPISESLYCPRNIYCLVTAEWHDSAWHVDRIMFSKQKGQLPLRITQLVTNFTEASSAHYVVIRGPRVGKVVFNQLSLGLTGQYITGINPFTRVPISKGYPLFLPSKLPDGVISFE
ncbi:hypothetical protein DSO57_1023777 [Entomophthora muscae]|uniref:Uncharacterized protein n=2 Tax=Entomophthora muscae TaxID=34485 RepID=A0ACC2T339_9FUNG|nr:hypothetical protein DSO57_1023776 [Entomophthora muscae]KAJ9068922.1 hypothetical protein DSO57_1023777 [Entomophthora muscae]